MSPSGARTLRSTSVVAVQSSLLIANVGRFENSAEVSSTRRASRQSLGILSPTVLLACSSLASPTDGAIQVRSSPKPKEGSNRSECNHRRPKTRSARFAIRELGKEPYFQAHNQVTTDCLERCGAPGYGRVCTKKDAKEEELQTSSRVNFIYQCEMFFGGSGWP